MCAAICRRRRETPANRASQASIAKKTFGVPFCCNIGQQSQFQAMKKALDRGSTGWLHITSCLYQERELKAASSACSHASTQGALKRPNHLPSTSSFVCVHAFRRASASHPMPCFAGMFLSGTVVVVRFGVPRRWSPVGGQFGGRRSAPPSPPSSRPPECSVSSRWLKALPRQATTAS